MINVFEYPIQYNVKGNMYIAHYFTAPHLNNSSQSPASAASYSKSFRKSFRSVDLAKTSHSEGGGGKRVKSADLPFSSDALNSLTSLCFPGV